MSTCVTFGFSLQLEIHVGHRIEGVSVSLGQPQIVQQSQMIAPVARIPPERQLRATWTHEAAEDLRNWHGVPDVLDDKKINWKKEGF